ncbi:hypothetical protein [Streptomyces sp. NPDC001380]|uniref:hypothetical protein n=1 Tax=Streptomyces sp. NPDC001380 TaxID=3364566 RepID=UPI0036947381
MLVRRVAVAVAALLVLGGGIAWGVAARGPSEAGSARREQELFRDRAAAVARAWPGSAAERAWRSGYHPLGALSVPPEGGFRDVADRRAFDGGLFELRAALPRSGGPEGAVVWADGSRASVGVLSARDAYAGLTRLRPACSARCTGHRLVVTAVRPGTARLATSRGRATVPAWLFTVRGYDRPVVRVATAGNGPALGALPEAEYSGPGREAVEYVAPAAPGDRRLTVGTGHGGCATGWGVRVYETDRVVVVGGWSRDAGGPCTSELLVDPVTVALARPLGSRTVLDAVTAAPLEARPW